MTRLHGVFQIITKLGLGHFGQTNVDSPQVVVQGVGTVRFQLDLGEVLEVHGVLLVLGMGVSKLLVSSLEDDGFGWMVSSGHVFLYRAEETVGTIILLSDWRDMLYVLRGEVVLPGSGGWLSNIESEDGAEVVGGQLMLSDEESGSL